MGKKLTLEKFIARANSVHDSLYDYSKVEYINCDTRVCIIDREYGEFWQTPYGHMKGYGSALRAINERADNKRMSIKQFVKRANKIHNYLYDYSKVDYKNISTRICIIDPKYGEFWQIPNDHLNGSGCPDRCSYNGKDSIHKDHIIPISILGSRKEIDKERPLYKFLNSEINIQETPGVENIRKGDLIELDGKQVRARHVRNDYNIIATLSKQLLNTNIEAIINEDKNYRK